MTDQHGKTDKDNTGIDKKYLSPSFFPFAGKYQQHVRVAISRKSPRLNQSLGKY